MGSLLEVERGHYSGFRKVGSGEPSSMAESIRVSRVDQLELQVDFLNETISELEKTISKLEQEKNVLSMEKNVHIEELTEEIHQVHERNSGLQRDLNQLEAMVKELEKTKRAFTESSGQKSAKNKTDPLSASRKPPPKPSISNKSLTTTKKSSEVQILQTELSESKSALKDAESAIEEMRAKYDALANEARGLRQDLLNVTRDLKMKSRQLEQLKKDHPDIHVEDARTLRTSAEESLMEKLYAENDNLQEKVVTLEKEMMAMESQLKEHQHQAAMFSNAETDLIKSRTLVTSLQQQNSTLQMEIERLTKRCELSEEQKRDLDGTRKQLLENLDESRTQIIRRDTRIHDLQENLFDVQEAYRVTESNLKDVQAQLNRTQTELDRFKSGKQSPKKQTGTDLMVEDYSEVHHLREENERLIRENNKLSQLQSKTNKARESPSMVDTARTISPTPSKEAPDADEMTRLKALISEKEREVSRLRDGLQIIQQEKQEVDDEKRQMSQQIESLHSTIGSLREQVARLSESRHADADVLGEHRRIVEELDKERDRWQQDLDFKAERIAELEHYIDGIKNHEDINIHQLQALQDEVMVLQHHIKDQEKEISSLRRQLDEAIAQRGIVDQERRRHVDEAEECRQEISQLHKELEMLQAEIGQLQNSKQQLTETLEAYEERIQSFEITIQNKETDYNQMMTTYRKLAHEHSELQAIVQKGTDDESRLRTELRMRENQIISLQQEQEERAAESQQMKMELEAYAHQCDSKCKIRVVDFISRFRLDKFTGSV